MAQMSGFIGGFSCVLHVLLWMLNGLAPCGVVTPQAQCQAGGFVAGNFMWDDVQEASLLSAPADGIFPGFSLKFTE